MVYEFAEEVHLIYISIFTMLPRQWRVGGISA